MHLYLRFPLSPIQAARGIRPQCQAQLVADQGTAIQVQPVLHYAGVVQNWLDLYCSPLVGDELGLALGTDSPRSLYRRKGKPEVEVHSVRVARRNTPQGTIVTDLVVAILQRRRGYSSADRKKEADERAADPPAEDQGDFSFYGGCTLLIDPSDSRIRLAITKHILSESRLHRERAFRTGAHPSLRATYFGDP